jgi:hypothetical protein
MIVVVEPEPEGLWGSVVPAPMIVIPIPAGTLMPEAQVHEPAGILITSPSTAVCVGPFITAFTSLLLQVAAVCVAACAVAPKMAVKKSPDKTRFMILVIGRLSLSVLPYENEADCAGTLPVFG